MSSSISKYFAEICKEPFLSREEEYRLACLYKDPSSPEKEREEAKRKLINSNLRFVFKKAKQAAGNDPVMFAELISAGNEGLMVGLEKYEPSKDVKFLSYAGWWVFQRMQNEMSDMRIVSLPIWKQQLSSKIQKLKEANGDDKITLEALQKEFPDTPEKDLLELSETRYLTYYIDDMSPELFWWNPIEETVDENIRSEQLLTQVNSLPNTEKLIILKSFGLGGYEPLSAKEICAELGLSKATFRVLKTNALAKLREVVSPSELS